MKSSSALFNWPKNWRAHRPSTTLIIFPKSTDQNSEKAIIQHSRKTLWLCIWGRLTHPQPPWEGLQVTNFDQCLHVVMVIGKCKDVFSGIFWLGGRGREEGIYWGSFLWRNLSWGKKLSMNGVQDFLALY